MKIKFFNRGLLNIIEQIDIKEIDIKAINIGESSIIIETKNGDKFLQEYFLKDMKPYKIK